MDLSDLGRAVTLFFARLDADLRLRRMHKGYGRRRGRGQW